MCPRIASDDMNRRVCRKPMPTLCRLCAALAAAVLLLSRGPSPAAEAGAQPRLDERAGAGPLAWWKLDEGTGNAVHDATGHGFEGMIRGAAANQCSER